MTDSTPKPLALIIEDDDKLSVIYAEAIKRAGFDSLIAHNGQQALDMLDHAPALIILDLHLPTISGDTLLHKIRQDNRLAKAQVIITTADPALADTLNEESDLVLLKPVSFSQLHDLALRLRSLMA